MLNIVPFGLIILNPPVKSPPTAILVSEIDEEVAKTHIVFTGPFKTELKLLLKFISKAPDVSTFTKFLQLFPS